MINIAERLKDCPKGTKLYSPLCGEVTLTTVNRDSRHPICVEGKTTEGDSISLSFTKYGQYGVHFNQGECLLFPSKENRDWSSFQNPFKDGDIVFYNNNVAIFKEWGDNTLFRTYCLFYTIDNNNLFSFFEVGKQLFGKSILRKEIRFATEEEKQKLFDVIKINGYKWNSETKTLEKLVKPKFKVGDRIRSKLTGCEYTITEIDDNSKVTVECADKTFIIFNFFDSYDYELIPVKPKFKVGDKIQKKNWNSYIKIKEITDSFYIDEHNAFKIPIEKQDEYELYLEKFDISTLKPFESKVLVRDGGIFNWIPAVFGYIKNINSYKYCVVGGNCYTQCIPYEGNEHLLGTIDDCDEYYKNW